MYDAENIVPGLSERILTPYSMVHLRDFLPVDSLHELAAYTMVVVMADYIPVVTMRPEHAAVLAAMKRTWTEHDHAMEGHAKDRYAALWHKAVEECQYREWASGLTVKNYASLVYGADTMGGKDLPAEETTDRWLLAAELFIETMAAGYGFGPRRGMDTLSLRALSANGLAHVLKYGAVQQDTLFDGNLGILPGYVVFDSAQRKIVLSCVDFAEGSVQKVRTYLSSLGSKHRANVNVVLDPLGERVIPGQVALQMPDWSTPSSEVH